MNDVLPQIGGFRFTTIKQIEKGMSNGGGSGDGWFVDMMGGGDFEVEGWDNYLTDEDADYYNSDTNVWN